MDCPQCTSDMNAMSNIHWECPACGEKKYITGIPADRAQRIRDCDTRICGALEKLVDRVTFDETDMAMLHDLYLFCRDESEYMDNLLSQSGDGGS